MREFYVYIMASKSAVLYIGVTNNLKRRVAQHIEGEGSDFVRRYRVTRLVYVESTTDVIAAIAREKQLKRWRRAKKVALIDRANPEWRDLAPDLFVRW